MTGAWTESTTWAGCRRWNACLPIVAWWPARTCERARTCLRRARRITALPGTATTTRGTSAPFMPAEGEHSASVVAVWEGGWRCRVSAGGFDLIVDEPRDKGGTGTGPMPTEYLLASMASCYALALAWAAGKRGVSLPDLAVKATGVYDGPRFSALRLQVTTSAPADLVRPLIKPALRVCYVSNTIKAPPPIDVVITGVGGAPGASGSPEAGGAPGAPGDQDAPA